MKSIKNIKWRNGTPNLSGTSILFFVPVHLVVSIPLPDEPGKINNPVVLSGSQKWYYWQCSPKTISGGSKKKSSRAGVSYENHVSGFIPGDNSEFVAMMDEMKEMRFICCRLDNNGYYKISGSKASPLEFSYSLEAKPSTRKGYLVSMKGDGRQPEYFYEGVLETSEGFVDTSTTQEVIDFSNVHLIHANKNFVSS